MGNSEREGDMMAGVYTLLIIGGWWVFNEFGKAQKGEKSFWDRWKNKDQ